MKITGSGWHATPNDLYGSGLAPYEIVVLGYLYRRAGPDGTSFPSLGTIARDCRMSREQARLTINGLVHAGWVAKETRAEPTGRTHSNLYRLTGGIPPRGIPYTTTLDTPIPPGGPEVLLTSEVHSVKEEGRVKPPARPRKSDVALETARAFLSEDARSLAREAATKFGWPPTAWRLRQEARHVQQLLDVGIPVAFLRSEVARRERLGTFTWLHTDLDLRRLQQTAEDAERQRLLDELLKTHWSG